MTSAPVVETETPAVSQTADARATRTLRRSLAARLVTVALLATAVLGVFIYFATRSLLTNGTEAQLGNEQASQNRAISNGLDFVGDSLAVIARDVATVDALAALAGGFEQLAVDSTMLGDEQTRALEAHYREVVEPRLADLEPTSEPLAGLLPTAPTGRYVQYHYIVANPFAANDRESLVTADGDVSAYGAAHAAHHPILDRQRRALGFSDLLLLDPSGNIVYSAEKRIDLGRHLDGDALLSEAIASVPRRLATAAVGEAVLIDFARNPAGDGSPTLLGAAAMFDAEGSIGAVVVEIPISALNRLTTAGSAWSELGLGDTGEIYVVGRDLLMRSDSRLWLEDPATYLERLATLEYPPEVGESIARFDTTVLLQQVDTAPVATAFDGARYVGRSRDYLNRPMLAVADRIDNDQVAWVVVAQIGEREAGRPLGDYVRRLALTAAILLPLVALAGVMVAGRFTRPFQPVVAAADRIANGDVDLEMQDLGSNEVSDVARRLQDVARFIRRQEDTLEQERQETSRMLRSAVPARLVDDLRGGHGEVDDIVDVATVVAITVRRLMDAPGLDAEAGAELGARVSRHLEAAAERLGLERVRSSADLHLFHSDLGLPSLEPSRAAEFAREAASVLDQLAEEAGVEALWGIGIDSGTVISGLVASDVLTYGVFGEPTQTAITLALLATPNAILIDRDTAHMLDGEWKLEDVADLTGPRGQDIRAVALSHDLRTPPAGARDEDAGPSAPPS
jgi:class 3 adenylate cyclase